MSLERGVIDADAEQGALPPPTAQDPSGAAITGKRRRAPLSPDEREFVAALPEDPNRDERDLLQKVRTLSRANSNGDPMNGRRTGLRCRFKGGTVERRYKLLREVDDPDNKGEKIEVEVERTRRTKVGPCLTLINVPEAATEADVIIAIRARRAHEEGIHGLSYAQ